MSKRRPVRITLEGEARDSGDRYLDARVEGIAMGGDLTIDTLSPSVTVEWLPESHEWRDGDVLQSPHNQQTLTIGRRLWCGTSNESATDLYVDERVADGVYVILRYQADEEAS